MKKRYYETPEMVIVAIHTEQQVLTVSGPSKNLRLLLLDDYLNYGGELGEEW